MFGSGSDRRVTSVRVQDNASGVVNANLTSRNSPFVLRGGTWSVVAGPVAVLGGLELAGSAVLTGPGELQTFSDVTWSDGSPFVALAWTHAAGVFSMRSSGTLGGSGLLGVTGSGQLRKDGSTATGLSLAFVATSLSLAAGQLSLTRAGSWDQPVVSIDAGATLVLSTAQFTLVSGFVVSGAGTLALKNGSTVVATATANLANCAQLHVTEGSTLSLAAAAATSVAQVTVVGDSSKLSVARSVHLSGPVSLTEGRVEVLTGAELTAAGGWAQSGGVLAVATGSVATLQGACVQSGGSITGNGNVTVSAGTLSVMSATWSGAGLLTVAGTGALVLAGPLSVQRPVGCVALAVALVFALP